jgi:adenine-specific DNA-methyltransferase
MTEKTTAAAQRSQYILNIVILVGLLHELINLHRLCEARARGKDPADADADWLYENKKRIIENVLYGVDLQQRAVEICKLRLWISLMVDYPLEVDPDNCALPDFRRALKKIAPLPNLDFKIRRANSLIEYIRGHAVNFPQAASDSRDFAFSLNKLASAKHRFYEARRKKEKRVARLDILEATAELARYEFSAAKLKYGFLPTEKDAERVAELARVEKEMGQLAVRVAAARKKGERQKEDDLERLSRIFNDEANPTFVWQLDFAEIFHRSPRSAQRRDSLLPDEDAKRAAANSQPSGFDLVLANPPYVRQEKFKDQKPLLQNAYECYTGVADLYVYFYERGVRLLGQGGVLSFISSNKFFRAGYGEKLRKYLADNCHIRSIIDFGELPVFAAGTDPAIIIATRNPPSSDAELQTAVIKDAADIDQLSQAVAARQKPRPQHTLQPDGWTLENAAVLALLRKLRRVGKPLNDVVAGRFYYGIKTGLNEAFVVDRATRDQLIAEHQSSAEILKPFVHGSDAKKWKVDLRDDWLIYVPWHFPLHLDDSVTGPSQAAEELFRKRYPAVYKHLLRYKQDLLRRNAAETGIRYEWYALQRWGAEYWREFEQPKIIFNETSKELHAFFDETGLYTNKTLFMLVAPQPKPLLAVLLSKTLDWLFRHEFPSWGDLWQGGRVQFRGDRMATVPVPVFSAADSSTLTRLVDGLLAAKRADNGAHAAELEAEINTHVYRLYGLTKDEIKMVEESIK